MCEASWSLRSRIHWEGKDEHITAAGGDKPHEICNHRYVHELEAVNRVCDELVSRELAHEKHIEILNQDNEPPCQADVEGHEEDESREENHLFEEYVER